MIKHLLIFALLLPIQLHAQGFAGLGSGADGFAVPRQDKPIIFPDDHGAHEDYRIEWWYLTANLRANDGTPYGLQWTLFRSALAPNKGTGWTTPQLWMGHAAVTTPTNHFVSERLARGGVGQSGVTNDPTFNAFIDDWSLRGTADLSKMDLTASGVGFSYKMDLQSQGPLVLQGNNGYSIKSAAGQASYYYSQPFYDIQGTLNLPEGPVHVSGNAWLDREWSSQPLASDQSGWDWFSLTFDTGARMMGFVLRSDTSPAYTSATWIDPDGTSTPFPDGAFRAIPLDTSHVADRDIPTKWNVRLDEKGVDVIVQAFNPNSWMDTSVPYWEGPVSVHGSHAGQGYLEMTGY